MKKAKTQKIKLKKANDELRRHKRIFKFKRRFVINKSENMKLQKINFYK